MGLWPLLHPWGTLPDICVAFSLEDCLYLRPWVGEGVGGRCAGPRTALQVLSDQL